MYKNKERGLNFVRKKIRERERERERVKKVLINNIYVD